MLNRQNVSNAVSHSNNNILNQYKPIQLEVKTPAEQFIITA